MYTAMENENRIKELEKKYWAGETNLIEETALQNAFKENSNAVSEELASLFRARETYSDNSLDENFESEFWELVDDSESRTSNRFSFFEFVKYAAVGIIIIGLGFALTKMINTNGGSGGQTIEVAESEMDTYESPELAFEEAKKALLMASGKLNGEEEKINELKRFHSATTAVKGSNKK